MKRPAVFLDRDGTINEQMGYINHISRFVFLPGAVEAIGILNRNRYLVIVVSNQSGVARGYFPLALVDEVHEHMKMVLKKSGVDIDGLFFCPHHPEGKVAKYSISCNCRKPKTGLIRKACEAFDIDMANSYVIGDRISDIELAHRSDLKGILVTTGYGLGEVTYLLSNATYKPVHIAADLFQAVRWIIMEREHRQKSDSCGSLDI